MTQLNNLQKETHGLIGETLIMMQKLESLVKLSLLVIHGQQNLDASVTKVLALEKKTLGNLITTIKQRVVIPADEYEILSNILAKRNLFVHELFMQQFFDVHTVNGLRQVNDFCHGLLRQSRQGIIILLAFCTDGDARVNFTKQEEEDFDRIFEKIVSTARPDFGELTFDQYLSKIQDEVNAQKADK